MNVACDQCGRTVDNTGTICNACLGNLIHRPMLVGLQPAQRGPKGNSVSQPATPSMIYVEFATTMLVGVNLATDSIDSVEYQPTRKMEPTGNHYANADTNALITVGVPTPPPKFPSIEEAEAWMEQHAGARSFDIEVEQALLDNAVSVVGSQIQNWIDG